MKYIIVVSALAALASAVTAQPPRVPQEDGPRRGEGAPAVRRDGARGRAVMPDTEIRTDRVPAPRGVDNPNRPLVTPGVSREPADSAIDRLRNRREVVTTPRSAPDAGVNTPRSARDEGINIRSTRGTPTAIDRSSDIDRSSSVDRSRAVDRSIDIDRSGSVDRGIQTNTPLQERNVGPETSGEADRRPQDGDNRKPGNLVITPRSGDLTNDESPVTPRSGKPSSDERPSLNRDTNTPTPGAGRTVGTPRADDDAVERTSPTPRGRGRGLDRTPASGEATPYVPTGTPPGGGRAIGREARQDTETPDGTPGAATDTPATATPTGRAGDTPSNRETPETGTASPSPSPARTTDADATPGTSPTPSANPTGTPDSTDAAATPGADASPTPRRRGQRDQQDPQTPMPTRTPVPDAAPIAATPVASPTPGATPVPTPAQVTPTPENFKVSKDWKPYSGWRPPSGWKPPRNWDIDWSVPPGYRPPREWHPRLYGWGWTYVSGRGWVIPRGWRPPPDFIIPPGWYYLPEERYVDYGFYNPGHVTIVRGIARPRVQINVQEIYLPPEPVPQYIAELPPPPPRPVPVAVPEVVRVESRDQVVEVLSRKRTEETNRYAGPVLVTESVHFDVDSYAIKPESFTALDVIGEAMTQPPLDTAILNVEGHTDSDASDEYNQLLSERRAWSVKSYLVEKWGIDPNRLIIVGFGESSPIADNDSAEGKARNRRVEFENVTDLYETEVKTASTEAKQF